MSELMATRVARALLRAYSESDPKRWPDHSICGLHTCGCSKRIGPKNVHARMTECHTDRRRSGG